MSFPQAQAAPPPTLGAELRLTAVYVLSGVIALLLQTTILHALSGGRAIPDLILILCVYLGLYEHNVGGAAGAFLFGYMLDSFSGSVVGLNALAMTSVYLVVYLASRRLWMDNTFSGISMVFLATFLKGVTVLGALAAYLTVDRLTLGAAQILLGEALLAAALTPLVFGFLRWARRTTGA
jgi:rod shape-determining protein MreD